MEAKALAGGMASARAGQATVLVMVVLAVAAPTTTPVSTTTAAVKEERGTSRIKVSAQFENENE